jgi:hypothetical protein
MNVFNFIKLLLFMLNHKEYYKIKLSHQYYKGIHLYLSNAFGYLKLIYLSAIIHTMNSYLYLERISLLYFTIYKVDFMFIFYFSSNLSILSSSFLRFDANLLIEALHCTL